MKNPAHRVRWLRSDRLLGEMGIPKDSAAGRRRFEEILERRRAEDLEGQFAAVRGGWCVGSEEFRRELLSQMTQAIRPNHYGAERQENAEHRAEQIIATELKRLRQSEASLRKSARGEPFKVKIAAQLRAQTTLPLKWIADRLQMGSRNYANYRLYQLRRNSK
jgi:hypothetical protein